jgi:hypothetical protein
MSNFVKLALDNGGSIHLRSSITDLDDFGSNASSNRVDVGAVTQVFYHEFDAQDA